MTYAGLWGQIDSLGFSPEEPESAAIPAGKAAADSEPANNTFPGEGATVGVDVFGSICTDFGCGGVDDVVDFYDYTGLTAGDSFDFHFIDDLDNGGLRAGRYSDGSQGWPSERLLAHQLDALGRLVAHAWGSVPFHRARLESFVSELAG